MSTDTLDVDYVQRAVDCPHTNVLIAYQYDVHKDRTSFWLCEHCHMKFAPVQRTGDAEALRQRVGGG